MTKQKRLYLPECEEFNSVATAHLVEKDIYFSTDPRDMGWIEENIPCQWACPARTNVPGYIRTIFEERYGRSYELNRFANLLPGVLGRICSRPCESFCRHGWEGNGESVAICYLKRAASDLKPLGHRIAEEMFGASGKTVAVVGSGPAGLGAAHDLSIFGHKVVLFEALSELGGMLRYGIPGFRLPKDLLKAEIDNVLRLGVELHANTRIGEDISFGDLSTQYDAVVLAAGTYNPNQLPIPGVDLKGVYSGLEFMMQVNMGEKIDVGDIVHVIGGGYTAMDCARTAMRLGAKRATVNIRGTEDYLQIEEHELFEVKLERVELRGLVSIQEVLGNGKVSGIKYKRNRLGPFLPNGERTGVPIEGSDFDEPVDTVILAVGQRPDTSFVDIDIEKTDKGLIKADPQTSAASREGIFLAGDFMDGASTIIESIGSGRKAAWKVDQYLIGKERRKRVVRVEKAEILRERDWDFIPRVEMPTLKLADRMAGDGLTEVETGYVAELATDESKRCYLCYLKFEIDASRCIYCRHCIDVAPKDCIKLARGVRFNEDGSYAGIDTTEDWSEVAAIAIDNKECIRCGACLTICPVKCIDVVKMELTEQAVAEEIPEE
jgi:formate dehydrogenase major subunit